MKCYVIELNVQSDHVHLVVSVPPKESISKLLGTVKGKTAIQIFRQFPYLKNKPYWGNHFWARDYCVDTVGIDEGNVHYLLAGRLSWGTIRIKRGTPTQTSMIEQKRYVV